MDLPAAIAVGFVALAGSTVAGVTGLGGTVVLLPMLVWAFGIRDAIPILSVVQMVASVSRTYFNRKDLVLPVAGWFIVGAAPGAVAGGMAFAVMPTDLIQRILGAFLLAVVAYQHSSFGRRMRVDALGFIVVGAVVGFLSSLVGIAGPLMVALFLSAGLTKGTLVGTDSLTATGINIVKLAVYGWNDFLGPTNLTVGLAVGAVMIVGSYAGRRILDRLSERTFRVAVEVLMVGSGLQFLLLS